ncbi:MAG: DEAD/DEAH box helicase [Myxococcales bacterium]|nr:DEAD/DEAH box helicase [Myxococcales bacterium]
MRLDEALTVEGLRRTAGATVFERGRDYYARGAVTQLMVAADAAHARVTGGADYEPRIVLARGALRSSCTCPYDGGLVCKHVVALGLAVLDRAPRAAPAPGERVGFASRDALEAWAAERQVTHALARPAATLADRIAVAPGWLFIGGRTVADVAVATTTIEPPAVAAARVAVARAACASLEDEAALVRAGLEEEARLLAATPEPGRALAWRRVLAARAAVRAAVPPRGSAALAGARLELDGNDATMVRWTERVAGVVVRWQGDAAQGSCTCRPGRQMVLREDGFAAVPDPDDGDAETRDAHRPAPAALPRCVHVLAAFDAMLRTLAGDDAAARALAAVIEREPWQLVLAHLEHLDAPVAGALPGEVWWRLRERYGQLELTPTIRKPQARGLSRGSAIPANELRSGRYDVAPVDRSAGAALESYGTPLPPQVRAALVMLIGHPRVVADDRELTPIAVRRARLAFEVVEAGDALRLVPTVDGRPLSPAARLALTRAGGAGVDFRPADGECLVIDTDRRSAGLLAAIERYGDRFPPTAHAALLDKLAAVDDRLPVAVPAALLGAAWATAPRVVLRVRLDPDGGLALEAWIRPAPEAPLVTPGEGREVLPLVRDGQRGHVRRELADEEARVARAIAALPVAPTVDDTGPRWRYRVTDGDDALTLAMALDELPAGVTAEWVARRPTVRRDVAASALTLTVSQKRDWLDVDGMVAVDGEQVDLAALIEAARAQRRFVQVGPDRWLELADALRAQLARLAAHRTKVRGQLVSSVAAVPAMLALADAGATIDGSAQWAALVARVRAAARSEPKLPRALRATLRDYQREGYAWMSRLAAWGAGGVLADDMGLGKTVQTIALLCARADQGAALVIAPTSVATNWMAELARFAPKLRAQLLAERGARAEVIDGARAGDVVVVSYALLHRERARLEARRFATVIFDEAQAIKNASTQRSQAARALDAEFRMALTGTPVENRVGELWAIFAAVFPPLFGPWEHFREAYAAPIDRDRSAAAQAELALALRPFVLRRRKDEVARELPARTEIALTIPLSDGEAALYEQVRLAAIAKLDKALPELGVNEQRIQILAELTRLRLAACHPRLHDPESAVPSSKLERLLELLEELRAEGHRALVFSQFVGHLTLVRAALDAAGISYQYLDGATPAATRGARVAAFQAGDGDVFLISLKAGGTGLNLTAADYVIHLDPWWNPAVEDQASDRAHRIGQTRPVTIYRLVAADTIEAKILELHAAKRDLAAAVLDGTDGALRTTSAELLALLGAAPATPVAATPRARGRAAR